MVNRESKETEAATETPRRTLVIALVFSAAFACAWVAAIGSRARPAERTLSRVALSGSGRWLAAGTPEGRITVWDQAGGAAPHHFRFAHGTLNDLRFSPDGRVLAIACGDLALYVPVEPAAAPRLLRSDQKNYGTVRFSGDGETLLAIDGSGAIETIEVRSGAARLRVCCSSVYGEVAFLPDEHSIVNAGHWPRIWDARTGALLGQFTAGRQVETLGPIGVERQAGVVLMGSQDGRVYAWDFKTRGLVARSAAQPGYVDALAVSPNGWIAYGSFGKTLRLWNPGTGEQRSLAGARPASNLVFGADGTSVIFGTTGGQIEVWDTGSGQRLRAFPAAR